MLVLTSDDRLQSYAISAGRAAPTVYENVWSFQQASDGSLFMIKADDTLWSGQPLQQIDTEVKKLQALDAHTIFVLKNDGTLSLRKTANAPPASTVSSQVAGDVRDFQALDARTVWVLDGDGKLWLEQGNFGPEPPAKLLVATNVR